MDGANANLDRDVQRGMRSGKFPAKRYSLPLLHNQIKTLESENIILTKDVEHDALTGLFSKKHFLNTLSTEISQLARIKPENIKDNVNFGIAVVFFDADHFKKVNDNYGHAVGDDVIRMVARSLNYRDSDVVARLMGDEFAMMMPTDNYQLLRDRFFGPHDDFKGSHKGSMLYDINMKLKSELDVYSSQNPDFDWQPTIYDGVPTYISAGMAFQGMRSIPTSPSPRLIDAFTANLISQADEAMYIAKGYRHSSGD